MNAKSIELQSIRQHCKTLRMPSVATQFQKIAEQAQRDEHSYVRYLDVLLSAEVEEREHRAVQRRLKEAQLPRAKTLEEFDFSQSPKVSARRIRELAEGDYIDHARPVLFLGDAGTGKTHLATALCVAACQQRRRVRFTTASRLVNELVEAREEHELSRVIRRYARYELLCIDELGYVPLADVGAALLHGPEQIADLPVPVAESPGAVRIGHPERSHLVEYLAPNSVFNSLPRQRSSPHLRPDDRLVTIDRVLHHASLGVA